jgi:hypothetical protein
VDFCQRGQQEQRIALRALVVLLAVFLSQADPLVEAVFTPDRAHDGEARSAQFAERAVVIGTLIRQKRKVRVLRPDDTATWYAAQGSRRLQAAVIGGAKPPLAGPRVAPQAGPAQVVWGVRTTVEPGDAVPE